VLVIIICLAVGATTVIAILTTASHFLFPPLPRSKEPFSRRLLEISTERYTPMLRVMDETYFDFFRSQPAFTPETAKQLRAKRYRLFVEYLDGFQSDFDAVVHGLKRIFTYLKEERPNMARLLARANSAFIWDFGVLRFRAYFWQWGFGKVDAGELLGVFDELNRNLRSMVATPKEETWTEWDDWESTS
jgi:hypothetical protein